MRIEAPKEALIDAPVALHLTGFAPNQKVLLKASTVDDFGRKWFSHAAFVTDASGNVDLATQAPQEGTYAVADATGLLWSLTIAPDEPIFSFVTKMSIEPSIIHFSAEVDGQEVAATDFKQLFMAEGVTRREIRENGLVGVYYRPAGVGSFPAILSLTGSDGGMGILNENKAALLASHGYAVLVLAYFNYEGVSPGLMNIPLEYFETALKWLQTQPEIDGSKLGVTGISRGGELVLLLGATFPQIKAVVAYSPSGVVWPGLSADPTVILPAWTYKGEPVPTLDVRQTPPQYMQEMASKIGTDETYDYAGFMKGVFTHAPNVNDAAIPVECTKGAVLMISGRDDQQWDAVTLSNIAYERLKANNHPYPYEHLVYDNVGHVIMFPNIPTTFDFMVHPVVPIRLGLGGKAQPNAAANADSWSRVLKFLGEVLG